jgi:hypothetical protein
MIVPPTARVTLTRGQTTQVTLSVPPLAHVLETLCPERSITTFSAALVGKVVDERTGEPANGVDVVAQWQHLTPRLAPSQRQTTSKTDANGIYALCGLEVGRPALVYVNSFDPRSEVLRVSFERGGVEIGDVGFNAVAEFHQTTRPIWRQDFTRRSRSW